MFKYKNIKKQKETLYLTWKDELKIPFEKGDAPCFIVSSKWQLITCLIENFINNGKIGHTRLPKYNKKLDRYEYFLTGKSAKFLAVSREKYIYYIKKISSAELKCAIYPLDRKVPNNPTLWIVEDSIEASKINNTLLADGNFIAMKPLPNLL